MNLYQKYHAGRDDERLQLFQIARRFYEEASRIEFVHQDYSLPLTIEDNSHGDAGLAHSDQYFIAKTQSLPSDPQALRDYLKDLGRGVGYTTTASDYVFRKRD